MLFAGFLSSVDKPDPGRIALLDAILFDVKKAFSELKFELRLDRRVINAQAILLSGKRSVLIYGGLALHPRMAEDSLIFVFLHEAGHHLALGPRLPFNPSLACDCVADAWAAGEGSEILHQASGRRLQISKAIDELEFFISAGARDFCSPEAVGQKCRNNRWQLRKSGVELDWAPSCEFTRS